MLSRAEPTKVGVLVEQPASHVPTDSEDEFDSDFTTDEEEEEQGDGAGAAAEDDGMLDEVRLQLKSHGSGAQVLHLLSRYSRLSAERTCMSIR